MFSINLQKTRNPLYQEDPKTSKGHTSPNNIAELLFRQPFQPKHIETCHIPIMVDHELEHDEHSKNKKTT